MSQQHRSGLRRICTAAVLGLAVLGAASAASAATASATTLAVIAESSNALLAFTAVAMPTPGSLVLASAGSLLLLRRRKSEG